LVDSKGKPIQLKRKLVSGRTSSALIHALEDLVPKLVAPVKPTTPPAEATTAKVDPWAPAKVDPWAPAKADLEEPPAEATPDAAGGLRTTARPAETTGSSSTPGYVLLGVGGAGLVAGAVFGVLSFSSYQSYSSDGRAGRQGSLPGDQSQANLFGAVAWSGLAVGLVGAAIGSYLLLSEPSHESEATP
jgi:hypothetical protein